MVERVECLGQRFYPHTPVMANERLTRRQTEIVVAVPELRPMNIPFTVGRLRCPDGGPGGDVQRQRE